MSDQKVEETQSDFEIDFSHTPFSNKESAEIRDVNVRKRAASKEAALDSEGKRACEGFSIVQLP